MKDLFVIKIGGNIIDDDGKLSAFLKAFASITEAKILVHGGGKIATDTGNKLGIESKYIKGRRITDDETIDLVTMVYGGLINKKIVAQLQAESCNAIGLTGTDANIILAKKRAFKEVDFGWVGDIETVDISLLNIFFEKSITPVFAPLTHDGKGNILNTNADTIASSLAVALSKEYKVKLIYCFDKKGVLQNMDDESSVVRFINKKKYAELLTEQKLFAGILPKIENAFAAIDAGVDAVIIGAAENLTENISEQNQGTLITN
jgi:acetylglutamate kinase